jgi:hypothetical protein
MSEFQAMEKLRVERNDNGGEAHRISHPQSGAEKDFVVHAAIEVLMSQSLLLHGMMTAAPSIESPLMAASASFA